jgi:probable rRNA maturation factor
VVDGSGQLPGAALEWLRSRGREALGVFGVRGEVRARVAGDEEMAAAHGRYMGESGPTDVLTFDLSEGGEGSGLLDADLLLGIGEARRQASERGHAVERELLLYLVHGVLHCLGHDDHDDAGYARMHAEEDRVLEAIGVGRTFDAGSLSARGTGVNA